MLIFLTLIEIALGMGTSDQVLIGSEMAKRSFSLHSKGKPDKIVEIVDAWRSKGSVKDSKIKAYNSFQRLFVPADNVDRQSEDGCMNKIKIERCLKLRQEDTRKKNHYDLISGKTHTDQTWIKAFG